MAEIDLRPGGEGLLTWHEHRLRTPAARAGEPPHALAFRWVRRTGAEPDAGIATLVEFTLTAEDGGTRLRVVATGSRELDWPAKEKTQHAEGNAHGWGVELDELRAYVTTLAQG